MKNFDLAKKIKELRSRKGFSQEELANICQLNLRTIQRIENAETEPRGDTLKRLANALNVSPDELIDWVELEDKRFLALLNLSALSFLVFPLLGIIIPLTLWIFKKDKIKYLDETGKRLLNFQISWSILLFSVYISVFFTFIGPFRPLRSIGGPEFMIISVIGLYLFNAILILINTIRSLKTKKVFYQPAIPFLR